jgi:hypothetical protein
MTRASPGIQQGCLVSVKQSFVGPLYQRCYQPTSLLSLARYKGSFHGLHQAHLASPITRKILAPIYIFVIVHEVVAVNIFHKHISYDVKFLNVKNGILCSSEFLNGCTILITKCKEVSHLPQITILYLLY